MSGVDGCAICGAAVPEHAPLCPHCGAHQAPATTDGAEASVGAGLFSPVRPNSPAPIQDDALPSASTRYADPPRPASPTQPSRSEPPGAMPLSAVAAAAPPMLCWFCNRAPHDAARTARYELHRDVRRGYTVQSGQLGGRVRYRQLFVPVPRCAGCAGSHRWAHRWAMAGFWLGMLVGVVASLTITLASNSPAVMLLGLAALPIAMFAGAKLGRLFYERRATRRGAGRWRRGDGFPAVAAQLQQGWKPGKPFLVTK
jgi:hypothetical protein